MGDRVQNRPDNLALEPAGPETPALVRLILLGRREAAAEFAGGGWHGGRGSLGPVPRAPPPVSVEEALEGLTTTTGECVGPAGESGMCVRGPVAAALQGFARSVGQVGAGSSPGPDSGRARAGSRALADAIEPAKAALGCDGEACVLEHPRFRSYAASHGVPASAVEAEIESRIKPVGPRTGHGWLSNHNIDDTLTRWAVAFPEFHTCPYSMMDFARTGAPLARVDLGRVLAGLEPLDLGAAGVRTRPAACFGCVLNTDVSSGPGKHWVAVFVDCRAPPGEPWTVEYFDSVGRPPPRPVVAWQARARAQLLRARPGGPVECLAVTEVDHQQSQTECGLYALYYIRRRLEGTPPRFFRERTVTDEAMTEFRKHCFRPAGS